MFKDRLKKAVEEGVLLVIKFGLVVFVLIFAINWFTGVVNGANNGNAAAVYLVKLQQKGYLPRIMPNGDIPDRVNANEEKH